MSSISSLLSTSPTWDQPASFQSYYGYPKISDVLIFAADSGDSPATPLTFGWSFEQVDHGLSL
jgi:hypothetical protein